VVLSEEDLTIVYEARDSKLALIACKYSPTGNYIYIYIYTHIYIYIHIYIYVYI
jgi:hypothetical protein